MPAAKEKTCLGVVARITALLLLLAASVASAQAPGAPENRVWEKSTPNTESLLSQPLQLLEPHQVKAPVGWYDASDYAFAAESAGTLPEGSFSIRDWSGYPQGAPQPEGPFRLLEGDEYDAARSAANSANQALRQADPAAYAGQQIHEIQPVKFGGSPTDLANKIPLPPQIHSQFTNWWNALMRSING